MASPMRCTRSALVRPGVPGGLPATRTTRSPSVQRPMARRAVSTWRTMSSVWCTAGTRNVSEPQVSASWLRVAASVVKASSGMGDRFRASRRAVPPVMVNATSALAPTIAPTSAAAWAMAEPTVSGAAVAAPGVSGVNGQDCSAATMIRATADSLKGQWDGPIWLLTDGGYAKRPMYAAARQAGWVTVTRLRRDAHLNDLPPASKPGQKRGRGRPRVYGINRIRLSLRAGQNRGWEAIEVEMSGGKIKRWEVKTFLATWRVAGGVVRVVLVREESDRSSWRAYVCSDPKATVQEIAQAVADRWGIEQVFHDVKENERIGQVQLRKVWANVGAFNLGLWVNSLVELWAWDRGASSLVDRSQSPWDDAERRASHGNRRKALQQELLDCEFQRCGVRGHGSRKIRELFQAVVKLVA